MKANVEFTADGGGATVRVEGRLDAAAAPEFEQILMPLAENPKVRRIVLDGERLEYIASAGLRVLLKAVKAMQPRRARILGTRFNESVTAVLDMTGFLAFIDRRSTERFRRDLADVPTGSDTEKIDYILLAARLANLPDGKALAFLRWADLAAETKETFADVLRMRVDDCSLAMDQCRGAELGAAVAEAQDFHLFQELARHHDATRYQRLVPPDLDTVIEVLVRRAETAPLDEEAAEYLVNWLVNYPIRQDRRLAVVAAPLSDEMASVAAGLMKPPKAPDPRT